MVAPLKQPTHKKTIKLLLQEKEGIYQFSGKFVATRAAIEKFGEAIVIACHMMLLKEVKRKGGLDYLQVFDIDGEKLWFIDDVNHVTYLCTLSLFKILSLTSKSQLTFTLMFYTSTTV